MSGKIEAFVGHSFADEDKEIIGQFTQYFNSQKAILTWQHAEEAMPERISDKIKNIFEGKSLFIGIFTKKYKAGNFFKKHWLPSFWIVQESGYAIGKQMKNGVFS